MISPLQICLFENCSVAEDFREIIALIDNGGIFELRHVMTRTLAGGEHA